MYRDEYSYQCLECEAENVSVEALQFDGSHAEFVCQNCGDHAWIQVLFEPYEIEFDWER